MAQAKREALKGEFHIHALLADTTLVGNVENSEAVLGVLMTHAAHEGRELLVHKGSRTGPADAVPLTGNLDRFRQHTRLPAVLSVLEVSQVQGHLAKEGTVNDEVRPALVADRGLVGRGEASGKGC